MDSRISSIFEERSECYQTIVEITPDNCVAHHLAPMNVEDEISDSESDSDSSRQADNWDSSSLDSGNEQSNSGEDASSSEQKGTVFRSHT